MPALSPDPFQPHPAGPWSERHRAIGLANVIAGLSRLAAGEITVEDFCSQRDKNGKRDRSLPANALWLVHHPDGRTPWRYVGRPYWSVAAYRLWHQRFWSLPEASRTRRSIPSLETLPTRANTTDPALRLVHEHVIPQNILLKLLSADPQRYLADEIRLRTLLASNLDAVISGAEDRRLPSATHPNIADPWARYAGSGIQFLPNPAWSEAERLALECHGLIAPGSSIQGFHI